MIRWNQAKELFFGVAHDTWSWVSSHAELVVMMGVMLIAAGMAVYLHRYLKRTEGGRAMARAAHDAEARMIADHMCNLLLHLYSRDRLSPERFDFWNRKLGLAMDLHDLLPRKRADELKKRLKRERNSTEPEMLAIREFKTTPAPLPDRGSTATRAKKVKGNGKADDVMAAFK